MSPAEFKEVEWLLMLIPFGVVLGTGAFFIYCAWRRASVPDDADDANDVKFEPSAASTYRFSHYEQPARWLVVKASHPGFVQAALNLHHPVPCSWEDGLLESREDKLFISPAISGWVLVAGSGLPGPFEDVDACFRFLAELSRKVGQVQFFCASRAVNHHAWALLERGHVYRGYAWAGETLWNQGPLTAAERELELRCYDYGSEHEAFSIRDGVAANAEKVNQLAGRWSIDPTAISAQGRGRGIVGELSQSKFH